MGFLNVNLVESRIVLKPAFGIGHPEFYLKPLASANQNRKMADARESIRRFLRR